MSLASVPELIDSSQCTHFPSDYPVVKASELSALNKAVTTADEALAAAKDRRGAIEAKCTVLRERLAAVPETPPETDDEHTAGLIAALAADPTHTPAEGDFAAVTQQRVAVRRAWETLVSEGQVVRQAIGKVEQEIAEIDAEIERCEADRACKWTEFLSAAHPFLIDRFRTKFSALVADTLQAANDLQRLKVNGRHLVPFDAWKISRDSSVELARYVRTERSLNAGGTMDGNVRQKDDLFTYEPGDLLEPSEAIMRFRDSLA